MCRPKNVPDHSKTSWNAVKKKGRNCFLLHFTKETSAIHVNMKSSKYAFHWINAAVCRMKLL